LSLKGYHLTLNPSFPAGREEKKKIAPIPSLTPPFPHEEKGEDLKGGTGVVWTRGWGVEADTVIRFFDCISE
jgi:hypothetical protein